MSDVTESTKPGSESAVIRCPRCQVRAQHVWTDVYVRGMGSSFAPFYDEAAGNIRVVNAASSTRRIPSKWRSAHCQGCDQKTLWRDGENVYPLTSRAPAAHQEMPPAVKALYEEAGRVLPLSRRAGAALVRAALEMQVKLLDKGAGKNDRLDDRIARLAPQVSAPLADLLDIIRHVGNASLHDDTDDLVVMYLSENNDADAIAEMMFDAVNELVEQLVAKPRATSALWDKLPPGVRATIERKRKAAEPA